MPDPTTTLPPGTVLPADTIRILNSPMLIMGLTKAGKSSLITTAAEYVWEVYRKVTLYYLTDGGGFPMQAQALINKGIMRLWKMRSRSAQGLAHQTCQRAAMGYWPRRINPRTGETTPDVELVPPVMTRIEVICTNGHVAKVVPFESLIPQTLTCPTCKAVVTKQTLTTRRASHRTKGFEDVGAVAFDGISSMLSWGMDDLSERAGRMELTGEKSALGGIVTSGDLSLAGSNRAQVGFMQKRAETLVGLSMSIPDLVIPPIWTALVQEGSDEGGLPIRGPQIIGQARTAEAPQWFGDTIEAIVIETGDGKKYRRMNLQTYVDKSGIRHLCGVRSFPGKLPPYLEDEDPPVDGKPFDNFSLATFFRLRDKARQETETEYDTKYPDAPGLPTGEAEVGEVGETSPPPTPAPPAVAPRAPQMGPPRTVGVPATPSATPVASAPVAPAPSIAAGPPAPPAPKPPARGPAPPPGRRPTPAPPGPVTK